MGCLYLVGIGLCPEDISKSALDVLARCNRVFCETYTSLIPDLEIPRLSKMLDNKVQPLNRTQVEDGSVIIDAFSKGDVSLLIPGDPMISTTHISLRVQAAKAGYESRIVHSTSILSAAIGESCLTATRFGRLATISFMPSAQPYDVLKENKSRGLHTLFLLDVDSEGDRYMSIRKALESLLSLEEEKGTGLIGKGTLAVGLARISLRDQVVKAGRVGDIMTYDFGGPPHSLIIPGELHFAESEALNIILGDVG